MQSKNTIRTWQQGSFVDSSNYRNWSPEQKRQADRAEHHNVRPTPTGNAVCRCEDPRDAEWVAYRLNRAAILEQMVYDYAAGKTDGEEIIAFITNVRGI